MTNGGDIGIITGLGSQTIFAGRQLVILTFKCLFSRQHVLGCFVGHFLGQLVCNGHIHCAGKAGDQDGHLPDASGVIQQCSNLAALP